MPSATRRPRSLYSRALKIAESDCGPFHWDTGIILKRTAFLFEATGRKEEARSLLERVKEINSLKLDGIKSGHESVEAGYRLRMMGRNTESEVQYLHALKVMEQELGADHPKSTYCLYELGSLYFWLGRIDEAEGTIRRGLAITERRRGVCHPLAGGYLLTIMGNICVQRKLSDDRKVIDQRKAHISELRLRTAEDNLVILERIPEVDETIFIQEIEELVKASYANWSADAEGGALKSRVTIAPGA